MNGRVGRALGSTADVLVVDRYRTGRLRLDAASGPPRWLARLGLVLLAVVNMSLLYGTRHGQWRQGPLMAVVPGNRPLFVPVALVPLTLVGLAVGWALVLWGAAASSAVVRLVAAVAFLLVNTDLTADVPLFGKSQALRLAHLVVRTGYFAVPVLLAGTVAVGRSSRWSARLRPAVLVGLLLAALAMFGGLVWTQALLASTERAAFIATQIEGVIDTAEVLIVPVLFGVVVEVLELAYALADTSTLEIRRFGAGVVRTLLVVLLGVKLAIQLVAHAGYWRAFVEHRQVTAARSVLAVAFFAGAGLLLRRPLRTPTEEVEGDEGLIYAGAIALTAPLLVIVGALSLGAFLFEQLGWRTAVRVLVTDLPTATLQRDGSVVATALVLLSGLVLLRRGWKPPVAAALVMVGAWALLDTAPQLWGVRLGFDAVLFDIAVTLVVAGFVAVRWRHLDSVSAARLGALVSFSWLVSTRGAYLTKALGGFLPAAATVTIVTGTLWALLTDSAFITRSSRLFPGEGRPLLWVGYLLTLATMTNWVAVTHGFDISQPVARGGFGRLGIPLAVWWVLSRRFHPAEAEGGPPVAIAS